MFSIRERLEPGIPTLAVKGNVGGGGNGLASEGPPDSPHHNGVEDGDRKFRTTTGRS